MGLLRQNAGKNWENPNNVPYYTGLQIQTSGNNVPIALVFGANKIAPNCIWTGGFYGYYGYPEWGANGGGKGGAFGGGGNNGAQAWQYYTSWEMALCEGPIAGLGTIWKGQSATNTYGADIWAVYTGSQTQTPWNILTTYFSGQALSYHGVAYVTSYNNYLGNSANLPQYSIEVFGVLFASSGIKGGDADPAQIVQDFLTSSQYGVGFPAASIDAAALFSPASGPGSSYQGYCRASYLALSPALTNQEAANTILARWLQLTNTAAVWSGGKLKFIPYGDSVVGPTQNKYVSAGVAFTPNVTPVYSLTDDDFIREDGKDPVEVTRADPFSLYNWRRLQINERVNSLLPLNVNEPWVLWQEENSYVPMPIDAWDQNAIELYGLRMAPDITANEICDRNVAQVAAQLILQRGLYIRNHYKFKLSFEYCLLDPMDLVTITDSALGLNNVVVRITEIEEERRRPIRLHRCRNGELIPIRRAPDVDDVRRDDAAADRVGRSGRPGREIEIAPDGRSAAESEIEPDSRARLSRDIDRKCDLRGARLRADGRFRRIMLAGHRRLGQKIGCRTASMTSLLLAWAASFCGAGSRHRPK